MPCFGHQDSFATVLLKPSLKGTKIIASQTGLGSNDLQQVTSFSLSVLISKMGLLLAQTPQVGLTEIMWPKLLGQCLAQSRCSPTTQWSYPQ